VIHSSITFRTTEPGEMEFSEFFHCIFCMSDETGTLGKLGLIKDQNEASPGFR
jgi:hypothetical protein